MAASTGGIFDRIVVNRCDFQQNLSSIASVNLSHNVKYLALLSDCGILQVFANGRAKEAIFEAENVRSFAGWQVPVGDDGLNYRFAIENNERELHFYEFQIGKWVCVHVIDYSLLKPLLNLQSSLAAEDFPELKFLGYQGLHREKLRLTVSNNTEIFVLNKCGNLSWESMKIPINEETLRICLTTAYQTKSRVYAISANFDSIYSFCLNTGNLLSSWSLQSLTCAGNPNILLKFDSSSRVSIWESIRKRRITISDTFGRLIVASQQDSTCRTENVSQEINDDLSVALSSSLYRDDDSVYKLGTLGECQSTSSRGGSISSFAHITSVSATKNKKLRSITGFNKTGNVTRSGAPSSSWTSQVFSPPGTITTFEIGAESLTVLYGPGNIHEEETAHGAIAILDADNLKEIAFSKFQEKTLVAFGGKWASPHLLMTERSIDAYPCLESQANIIGKMMLFESGAHAEALARINEWDTVSIPIGVLARGLKHRLAEAVAFFLKTKDNLIKDRPEHEVNVALSELETIAEQLVTAIRDNMAEIGARRFAEHLLCITINFLNRLLRNTVCSNFNAAVISNINKKIMCYLVPLRTLLKNYQKKNFTVKRGIGLEDTIERVSSLNSFWEKWAGMQNIDEVIRDGIVNNHVLAVQAFLLRHEESLDSLSMISKSGLWWTKELLMAKDIILAKRVLMTLGLEPTRKLREICFSSSDKILREYIIEEISKDESLSSDDTAAVDFLHRVEKFYPCQLFKNSHYLMKDKRYWEIHKVHNTSELKSDNIGIDDDDCEMKFGEIGNSDMEQCVDGEYSHLLLEWVLQWSLCDTGRVLTEAFLNSESAITDGELPSLMTADVAWNYLLEHGDTKRLVAWIETNRCKVVDKVERGNESLGEITQSMIDRIYLHSPSSAWNEILNCLAKFGLFTSTESEDFSSLLNRLNVSGKVTERLFDVAGFPERLLQYCVQNQLGHALFHFLDHFGMSSQSLEHFLDVDDEAPPSWLVMVAKFKDWCEEHNDAERLCLASLSCVGFSSDVTNPTIDHLVREGKTLAAVASLLYVPGSLAGTLNPPAALSMTSEDPRKKAVRKVLSDAIASYPSLKRCLLNEDSVTDSKDTLYYILLQDNTALDVSCLFGWQVNNPLRSNEAFTEIPHFSHPEYVTAYGHSESPNVAYYLTNARPGFALSHFIATEIKFHGTVTDNSICELANECIHVAIHHIDDPQIVASCVALIEMLGKNSHYLRVVNNFAKCSDGAIQDHGTDDRYLDLRKMLLQNSNGDKQPLAAFILRLESAVLKQLLHDQSSPRMEFGLALQLGNLVRFCRIHNLPYPTMFLQDCAKADDWLLFFVFVQIFCYPHHQVLNAVRQFNDTALLGHLLNALSKPQFQTVRRKAKSLVKKDRVAKEKILIQRDSRNALYSRMGFAKQGSRQPAKQANEHVGSPSSEVSLASESEESSADSSKVDVEEITDDLLGAVLQCHKNSHPWLSLLDCAVKFQNPLLAVLASCYKDCSVVHAMCSWIDACGVHFAGREISDVANLQGLQKRIKDAVQLKQLSLLFSVFRIFLPKSPILHLLASVNELIVNKSPSRSLQHMKEFENTLRNLQDVDCQNAVFTVHWVKETSEMIIFGGLGLCEENHARAGFLEILHEANVATCFSKQSGKPCTYLTLLELHKLLENTCIMMDLTICPKGFDDTEFAAHCRHIVNQLVEDKRYNAAYKFAELCGLQCDHVIILQMQDELRCYRRNELALMHGDQHFWKKCVRVFAENNVSIQDVANFFLEAAGEMDDPYDKCIALRLCLAFLTCLNDQSAGNVNEITELERDMWYAWIQAVDRNPSLGSQSPMNILEDYRCQDMFSHVSTSPVERKPGEAIISDSIPDFTGKTNVDLTTNELAVLDQVIGNLADQVNVQKAVQLCKYFNHQSQCINIIQTCLRLASGDLLPRDLDLSKRLPPLRATKGNRSRTTSLTVPMSMSRSLSVSSLSSLSASTLQTPEMSSESTEILELMETMLLHCEHGARYCARLIAYYKISLVLGKSFSDVFSCQQDRFFLLQNLLLSKSADKFLLAKDFIATEALTDGQVALFLCEQIVWTLRVYCGNVSAGAVHLRSACDLIFRPTDSPSSFAQLIKLCQDPSLLGFKLLQAIENHGHTAGAAENSLKVEILICAHSCFTVSCNVEGITCSLKIAKEFSQSLAKIGEFILMVRLLTGIGRYPEMMYIFDMLQEHDQFELLFRKGMEKVPDLKTALIDYLRRSFPEDTETFTMVALRFSMHREIAELLESAAKKNMIVLAEKMPEGNRAELNESLERTMQFMADAYESFLKADCIRHALTCAKQAELLALQIHLLPFQKNVIGLNPTKVTEFIISHGVNEGIIVAEAYNQHHDWPQALYLQFVINGDQAYLQDYLTKFELSSAIIDEVVKRFKNDGSPRDKFGNMRKLLDSVVDVRLKYTVALDLELDDLIGHLVSGDSGPLLNDTEKIQYTVSLK